MYKKNIMLCIDLRTLLREDALLKVGKAYFGSLVLDDEFGASFVERGCMAPEKRNVRLFNGHFITLTYRFRDGHVRFNFKEVNAGEEFDVERFAVGVMREIRQAWECLVEETRRGEANCPQGEASEKEGKPRE